MHKKLSLPTSFSIGVLFVIKPVLPMYYIPADFVQFPKIIVETSQWRHDCMSISKYEVQSALFNLFGICPDVNYRLLSAIISFNAIFIYRI